jgi:hypothetical protein
VCRQVPVSPAGAPAICSAFSQLELEGQNYKKCDNIKELSVFTINNGNIEFVESTM